MNDDVLRFEQVDRTRIAAVGGKAAQLAELSRVAGVRVPPGFCITTHAFQRILRDVPSIDDRLDGLARLPPDDREAIAALSAEMRRAIEALPIPGDLVDAISAALAPLGEHAAYAVRSSATAEDSPTASFAGQQDTYLNVVGRAAILEHVSRCWASLFTERAVTYRLRNGVGHRGVHMGVVVQQMVFPHASGILFTADPISGNRKLASVEASFGLGEALVSGLVNADVYKVRGDEIVTRKLGDKLLSIRPSPAGGTQKYTVAPEQRAQPALTDTQLVRLVRLGRQIEAHFGRPQDIEWCLLDDAFYIVQSRPITTLFPVPAVSDSDHHVYISVGHQQMMTDAMKPLGLSLFKLTTRAPMHEAGGRLFVDVTRALASPASRAGLLAVIAKSEPLIRAALETVLERGDFIPSLPDPVPAGPPPAGAPAAIDPDPAVVAALIEKSRASVAVLKRDIQAKSGSALLDFILADLTELQRSLFDPESQRVVMAAHEATWWLNEHLRTWLGEKNASGTLTQSVPNNVTSEMGLALLDLADVIRPHAELVAFLQQVDNETFLEDLENVPGGARVRDAIQAYLERYGMRCVGEIDITRPRWSEDPRALVPILLANIKNFEPGEAARRFERGREEAQKHERELLERLRALPEGAQKAEATKRMIDRLRAFIGYREYPKYGMISRYLVYKQALMQEAERLVQARVLREKEDIFYLTLQELHAVTRTHQVDDELIRQRKDAFRWYQTLTPPRVLTSDGEGIAGAYRRDDLPADALIGSGVSAGTVEGRARVILDVADAALEAGDILVTVYTDPSWTPLFVAIAGLVTEVGGLMTHGAVIAREYGVPAVVSVENATRRIRDGQRIRVHGSDGYVELLSEPGQPEH